MGLADDAEDCGQRLEIRRYGAETSACETVVLAGLERDAAVGGLETEDAAETGRDPDRQGSVVLVWGLKLPYHWLWHRYHQYNQHPV